MLVIAGKYVYFTLHFATQCTRTHYITHFSTRCKHKQTLPHGGCKGAEPPANWFLKEPTQQWKEVTGEPLHTIFLFLFSKEKEKTHRGRDPHPSKTTTYMGDARGQSPLLNGVQG